MDRYRIRYEYNITINQEKKNVKKRTIIT